MSRDARGLPLLLLQFRLLQVLDALWVLTPRVYPECIKNLYEGRLLCMESTMPIQVLPARSSAVFPPGLIDGGRGPGTEDVGAPEPARWGGAGCCART